ncbi:amidase domain-containing protein [Syntrophomonas zehnderi]|uniref:amidase domain-containing protein n=1 Tax=Syntrophomonas zehnderi TaxID=404335 RepID=UPI0009798AEF
MDLILLTQISRTGGGDCTNYASQVLHDGGGAPFYPSPNTGISGSDRWFYRSANDRSSSWTGAGELQTFLLNNTTKGPYGQVSSTFGSLNSGDIIQLSSSGEYYHSIVVHTPGGDPTVTAHTNAYSGYYSTRYGGISNLKIHITGYYN